MEISAISSSAASDPAMTAGETRAGVGQGEALLRVVTSMPNGLTPNGEKQTRHEGETRRQR